MNLLRSLLKTKSEVRDCNVSMMTCGNKTAIMQTQIEDGKRTCIITPLNSNQARQLQKEIEKWESEGD